MLDCVAGPLVGLERPLRSGTRATSDPLVGLDVGQEHQCAGQERESHPARRSRLLVVNVRICDDHILTLLTLHLFLIFI